MLLLLLQRILRRLRGGACVRIMNQRLSLHSGCSTATLKIWNSIPLDSRTAQSFTSFHFEVKINLE
jgi:hypothetical protein